jgi:hypothetical protein
MKTRLLTAFFSGRSQAEGAVSSLLAAGVAPDEISVIPKHVGHPDDLGLYPTSKASEGMAVGAVTGGLLGAIGGAVAAAGAIVIPGAGTVLAGPVVAALAGAGAGGALGTLIGALVGVRVPEFEARYLEDAVGMGGALLAVRCRPALASKIEQILETSGARLLRRAWLRG